MKSQIALKNWIDTALYTLEYVMSDTSTEFGLYCPSPSIFSEHGRYYSADSKINKWKNS